MTIDVRILLPFAGPFIVLLLMRIIWFAAGAPWTEPAIAAAFSCFIGASLGLAAAITLYSENIEIGKIQIGKGKP